MPTIAVNTAPESDDSLRININGRVVVRTAADGQIARPITAVLFNDTELFAFPNQGAFNANAIIGPGWKLFFYNAVTGVQETVFADDDLLLSHSQPVTVDRRGELPMIYVQSALGYRIVAQNQYGVEKHRIDYFMLPDVVQKFGVIGTATEADAAMTITPA